MKKTLLLAVIVVLAAEVCWTDGWNIELIGRALTFAWDINVSGDYAYVCSGGNLLILDITDPSSPTEVSQIANLPSTVYGVDVVGKNVYALLLNGSLQVIDVSDPKSPQKLGFHKTRAANGFGIHVTGGHAYLGDSEGLTVIDVSDPNELVEVGNYDMPDDIPRVYVTGDHAYITGSDGLHVIDVSEPENPREVGLCETAGRPLEVYVAGSHAYVVVLAGNTAGLSVIDISDPAAPREVGLYNTPGNIIEKAEIQVSGKYAYMTTGDSGLHIIDVSNPETPHEVASYDIQNRAYGMDVDKNNVYVCARDSLYILRVTAGSEHVKPGSKSVALWGSVKSSGDSFHTGQMAE